jgi:1-acyl-sn-glycerol-3-phosphate acyltransferase
MQTIRAAIRGILVAIFIVVHLTPALVKALAKGVDLPFALRMRRLWARRTLRMLGVKVDIKGTLPQGGPFMFIGNHRSYLDPVIVLKDLEAIPVAKAEVSSWPLIGFAARATGAMYVKRESKDSRTSTLKAMNRTLKNGYSVLVYPEGTTHDEPVTRSFKKGAFALAANEGFQVVPMAIDYLDQRDAWIGKDTFVPHFMRCFGKKKTFVKIAYGKPVLSNDTAVLLSETKDWIDRTLIEIRREFDKETQVGDAR